MFGKKCHFRSLVGHANFRRQFVKRMVPAGAFLLAAPKRIRLSNVKQKMPNAFPHVVRANIGWWEPPKIMRQRVALGA